MERYVLVWDNGDKETLSYSEIDKIFKAKPRMGFKVWCEYKGDGYYCGGWNGKEMI